VLGALSLWVKQPEHEADHSPTYSAKDKNAWSYNSISSYIFMAWCLVKYSIHLNGMVLTQAQELHLLPRQHEN